MTAFTHHHTLPYTPHTPLHTAHSPTDHTLPYTAHTPLHTTHSPTHHTHLHSTHTYTAHTHTHTHPTLPYTPHMLHATTTLPTHSKRCARHKYMLPRRTVPRRSWSVVQTSLPTAHLPVPVQWGVDGSPARTRTCRRSRTGTARATATQSLKSPSTIAAAAAAWVDASVRLRRPSYLSLPYVYVK